MRNSTLKNMYKIVLPLLLISMIQGCSEKNDDKDKVETRIKSYAGKSIMLIVPKLNADVVRGPILKEAKAFEEKTGAKIRVVTPNWNETIKSINDSISHKDDPLYDIYVVIGLWNGSLLSKPDIIAPLPQWVKDKVEWSDILPIYKI